MNPETLMLRQVRAMYLRSGIPSSQAFTPFPKDNGQLSVDSGELISPKQSYLAFTEDQGCESVGVWSISCAEASELDVPAEKSPQDHNLAHCHLDFSGHSKSKAKTIAKKLSKIAADRGKLHPKAS